MLHRQLNLPRVVPRSQLEAQAVPLHQWQVTLHVDARTPGWKVETRTVTLMVRCQCHADQVVDWQHWSKRSDAREQKQQLRRGRKRIAEPWWQ